MPVKTPVFSDGTVVHFGHSAYEQFKDSTGAEAWSHKDHGDEKRRANYHKRHKCAEEKDKKSPNYLSGFYLWLTDQNGVKAEYLIYITV